MTLQGLQQKGVAPDVINSATSAFFSSSSQELSFLSPHTAEFKDSSDDFSVNDGQEAADEYADYSDVPMGKAAWLRLVSEAEKVWLRNAGSGDREARKRRLMGWLQRRGHKWDVVWKVVRQVTESTT